MSCPNITLLTSVSQCQKNFPFTWQLDAITYLGIQFPACLSDLSSKSVLPVLCTVAEDLRRWDKPIGWVATLKMKVLPACFISYR